MKQSLPRALTIGWRIAHIIAAALIAMLISTGLRLAWYRYPQWPDSWRNLLDAIAPSGKVHQWHLEAGLALLYIGFFYLAALIFGRLQPFRYFRQQSNRSLKSIILTLGIISALFSLLSGFCMYGTISYGISAASVALIHIFSSIGLVFSAVAMLVIAVSSKPGRERILKGSETVASKPAIGKRTAFSFAAALLMVTCCGIWLVLFLVEPPTLICVLQNRNVMVDGKETDLEWYGVNEIAFDVEGGANFTGGHSRVRLKSFRNRHYVYFLIKWNDPDRSYNRFLEKQERGWVEQRTEPESFFGENYMWEDGLAVSFDRDKSGCMATCHLGKSAGPGRHYTDGDTVDVWQWKAVSTDPAWQAEDGWWGEDLDQVFGGSHVDNRAGGGYRSNLNREWGQPYFLPRFYRIRHWIDVTTQTFDPYSVEGDTFSIGSLVPSVVVAPAMGDVADVRARARWRGGVWTLEMSRPVAPGSPFDLPLIGEIYISLAPFDNSQKGHAFNLRPIRLLFK